MEMFSSDLSAVAALMFGLAFLLAMAVPLLTQLYVRNRALLSVSWLSERMCFVVWPLATFLVVVLAILVSNVAPEAMGLQWPTFPSLWSWTTLSCVVAASLVLLALVTGVNVRRGREQLPETITYGSMSLRRMTWATTVFAPVNEELAARVFPFVLIASVVPDIPLWIPLLVTSALFGMAHWKVQSIVFCSLLGLLMATALVETGSVLVPIGLHMAINLRIGLMMVIAGPSERAKLRATLRPSGNDRCAYAANALVVRLRDKELSDAGARPARITDQRLCEGVGYLLQRVWSQAELLDEYAPNIMARLQAHRDAHPVGSAVLMGALGVGPPIPEQIGATAVDDVLALAEDDLNALFADDADKVNEAIYCAVDYRGEAVDSSVKRVAHDRLTNADLRRFGIEIVLLLDASPHLMKVNARYFSQSDDAYRSVDVGLPILQRLYRDLQSPVSVVRDWADPALLDRTEVTFEEWDVLVHMTEQQLFRYQLFRGIPGARVIADVPWLGGGNSETKDSVLAERAQSILLSTLALSEGEDAVSIGWRDRELATALVDSMSELLHLLTTDIQSSLQPNEPAPSATFLQLLDNKSYWTPWVLAARARKVNPKAVPSFDEMLEQFGTPVGDIGVWWEDCVLYANRFFDWLQKTDGRSKAQWLEAWSAPSIGCHSVSHPPSDERASA